MLSLIMQGPLKQMNLFAETVQHMFFLLSFSHLRRGDLRYTAILFKSFSHYVVFASLTRRILVHNDTAEIFPISILNKLLNKRFKDTLQESRRRYDKHILNKNFKQVLQQAPKYASTLACKLTIKYVVKASSNVICLEQLF